MHKIGAIVIAIGLASGMIGAFAYDQLGSNAGAAPPPPSPTQVREQNLDGSGFIRVHEQGTANVNVNNLPLDAAGNVRISATPQHATGQLILLAENIQLLPTQRTFISSYADTSACGSLAVFTKHANSQYGVGLFLSVDGTVDNGQAQPQHSTQGSGGFAYYFHESSDAPMAAVFLGSATPDASVTIEKVWLYCVP